MTEAERKAYAAGARDMRERAAKEAYRQADAAFASGNESIELGALRCREAISRLYVPADNDPLQPLADETQRCEADNALVEALREIERLATLHMAGGVATTRVSIIRDRARAALEKLEGRG